MCGIVTYLGPDAAAPHLLSSLQRLEYRGYDSAGIATLAAGKLHVARAVGKLTGLRRALEETPCAGAVGIGHTRWATHGRPTEHNAHPHVVGDLAVVHNGIIENHLELKAELVADGAVFTSDTDTEIIAHLMQRALSEEAADLGLALASALSRVRGTYAVAVLCERFPDRVVLAKQSSPLVLGCADGLMVAGSDIPALLPFTQDMVFLEDGDVATLTRAGFTVRDAQGATVERSAERIAWSPGLAEKAGYKHFMLKEIFEQPRAIEDTLRGRVLRESGTINGQELGLSDDVIRATERVVIMACGTSYHAALVGRALIETLARVPCVVELASEYRSRVPVVQPGDLVIAVSQSGETVDTLLAANVAKAAGATLLAIVNVVGSAIARTAHGAFYTHAGPEIGVASTKCFSAQLVNLAVFALHLAMLKKELPAAEERALIEGLAQLPVLMTQALEQCSDKVAGLARTFHQVRDMLFLGRGLSFPIALEGALKLKEISYIHAEGYAAGELKHGPIALIDAEMPVMVIAPRDEVYERTLSNLQETQAREATVIAIGEAGDARLADVSDHFIAVPAAPHPALHPLLTVLPLQLFAYYVADFKGTDVDQPRNLAKTVTVE